MHRLELVNRGRLLLVPEASKACDALEESAAKYDAKVEILPSAPNADLPESLSLHSAGRELRIRLSSPKTKGPYQRVASAWSLAIPLGFTPWRRYPVPGPEDDLFHYLGPWQSLYDRLCAEGRGELAWPSVCCAAQVDVGAWRGSNPVERFVQAQLARIGAYCGMIDGVVGPRTVRALRSTGLDDLTLSMSAKDLCDREQAAEKRKENPTVGHIVCPNRQLSISTHGDIAAVRTRDGYTLSVQGEGSAWISFGRQT